MEARGRCSEESGGVSMDLILDLVIASRTLAEHGVGTV